MNVQHPFLPSQGIGSDISLYLRNGNIRMANILKLSVVIIYAWMSLLIYSTMYTSWMLTDLQYSFLSPQGTGSWTYPNHCLISTYQCLFMICMRGDLFYIFIFRKTYNNDIIVSTVHSQNTTQIIVQLCDVDMEIKSVKYGESRPLCIFLGRKQEKTVF